MRWQNWRTLGKWVGYASWAAILSACAPTRHLIDTTSLQKEWAECDIGTDAPQLTSCLVTNLQRADSALDGSYRALMRANSGEEAELIALEQQLWLTLRDRECRVTLRQRPGVSWADELAQDSAQALCVLTFTRLRESELRLSGGSSVARVMAARVQPRRTYQYSSFESHNEGKWYFEVFIDTTQLALAMDALIFVGIQSESGDVGRLLKVRPDGGRVGGLVLLPAKARIGVAVDLDVGQVYIRENGKWLAGAPDTGAGLPIRRNTRIKATVNSSVTLNAAVDQKLVQINYGTIPFLSSPPTGYSPYRAGTPSRDRDINSPETGTYVSQ